MRIGIREQLGGLILLASLVGLAVIAVATWATNHSFVLDVSRSSLQTTASLKAAQISSNLELMQTSANFVSTRVLIQRALARYNNGSNTTVENWTAANADMSAALGNVGSVNKALVLQTELFSRNSSGPAGRYSVMNSTGYNVENITLPFPGSDGQPARLGDNSYGFPPSLYPNLTITTEQMDDGTNYSVAHYDNNYLGLGSTLVLGPLQVNSSFTLLSMTLPVLNNTDSRDIMGWLTVVMDGRLIQQVVSAKEGLQRTGQTLVIGPVNATNRFPRGVLWNNGGPPPNDDFLVEYIAPLNSSDHQRHPNNVMGTQNPPFPASSYPAVVQALTMDNPGLDNAGSMLETYNEARKEVSVGYAVPPTDMVNWVIIVEQSRKEVWQPINHLRDVILACVFSTAGFVAIVAFIIAHFFSLPIKRLRAATERTIVPNPPARRSRQTLHSFSSSNEDSGNGDVTSDAILARKEGLYNPITYWRHRKHNERKSHEEEQDRRDVYRIPGKVKEYRHWIDDELSDLTGTFNEMSQELLMQYERLEERVRQRTAELEQSKKAAEAANESKTLFIANISHELKTPLNGILGMCAVCMSEDDPLRVKRSLQIIYKSGDLLLNLLTDLLTFSRNQVGQQLTLDEKEFRIRDISSQVLAIFDRQANEGQINLSVQFQGPPSIFTDGVPLLPVELGPGRSEGGRTKDMILWGDPHRVLQVVINLVGNSLKFTPAGGSVALTIRCLDEVPPEVSRKGSQNSRQSRQRSSRYKGSENSLAGSNQPVQTATANVINATETPMAHLRAMERAASPPPGKDLYFEFEIVDTGPGIPEDMQQKIFEPFMQGDIGLSKKHGGTGLGLSICSQLAGLMRGSIGVTSELGKGSTFSMKIPLRHLATRADSTASSSITEELGKRRMSVDAGSITPMTPAARSLRPTPQCSREDLPNMNLSEKAAPGPQNSSNESPAGAQPARLIGFSQPYFSNGSHMLDNASQPKAAIDKAKEDANKKGSKIRVLVAEDNKVNQEVVLRMLKLEDITDVTIAKDGQEALDLVKESLKSGMTENEQYSVIFMDVQMPNMDGLTSTKLIRETGFAKPIVALTAFAEESNINDCYGSGMNYFLSKPIRRPQLKKVLTKYCAPIPEEPE
ncbi:hypothetical protein K431DRAFT_192960, partial [Polychaeton citri CBS 116435]